jgi:hypothetical protein
VLILAAAGGLLGLALSAAGNKWLQLIWPAAQRTTSNAPPFIAIIALLAALAVTATILCGLAPAFHITGGELYTFLKTGKSAISSPRRRRGATSHELLAGFQLVLAMALLISTGLLLRSMNNRLNLPLGFQYQNIAVIETGAPPPLPALIEARQNYYSKHNPSDPNRDYVGKDAIAIANALKPWTDAERTRNKLFYNAAIKALAGLPGAVSVAMMSPAPFKRGGMPMGAGANQVRRLVLWRILRIAVASLPLGAFTAWGLAHGLAHWLFQVGIADLTS